MFKKISSSVFILATIIGASSCEPDYTEEQIPFQPFPDIVINTSLPAYTALQIDGGYQQISNVVLRGIIVYRVNATTFRAFEQTCSFQPNNTCATVEPFPFYMQDACCGSVFDYEGNPTGGMARFPLGQYEVRVSGSTITITDNVINY